MNDNAGFFFGDVIFSVNAYLKYKTNNLVPQSYSPVTGYLRIPFAISITAEA